MHAKFRGRFSCSGTSSVRRLGGSGFGNVPGPARTGSPAVSGGSTMSSQGSLKGSELSGV